mmetsp:Transcript_20565/g.47527  ORF Transcript_20565/g.47527 Transcript_20565/m.47527 type:complete len:295 (+) Transcript_20565:100-984(+)
MISLFPHATDKEDVISSIEAMRAQEQKGYRRPERKLCLEEEERRCKMVDWCYVVVDYCKFGRESVAITMSLLDCFLATKEAKEALQNPVVYQLAAMACLYIAVKVHEPEAMDPKLVSEISKGTYTEDEIVDMESTILGAIGFRVTPPTPLAFAHHFCALVPGDAPKTDLLDLARLQTELAVYDPTLIFVDASAIALAAIANAMKRFGVYGRKEVMQTLGLLGTTDVESDLVHKTRKILSRAVRVSTELLYATAAHNNDNNNTGIPRTKTLAPNKPIAEKTEEVQESPRCVSEVQ